MSWRRRRTPGARNGRESLPEAAHKVSRCMVVCPRVPTAISRVKKDAAFLAAAVNGLGLCAMRTEAPIVSSVAGDWRPASRALPRVGGRRASSGWHPDSAVRPRWWAQTSWQQPAARQARRECVPPALFVVAAEINCRAPLRRDLHMPRPWLKSPQA